MPAVLKRDGFDRMIYDQARAAVPGIEEAEDQGNARGLPAEDLVRDVHAALYKADPKVDPKSTAAPISHALIGGLMETTEYESLRQTTSMNEAASAMATDALAKALIARAPKNAASDPDATRRLVRQLLRQVKGDVEAKLEDAGSLLGPQGSGDGGAPALSDLQMVTAAAEAVRNSAKLRQIANLAGRMRRLALRKHRDRLRHGPDEVVDVEVGRDPGRMLPSELVQLRHPLLRKDLLRRFAEGQCLQYRMQTNEPQAKGPIVCCIDTSGSMNGPREVWSKALALGLCAIALADKRDVALVLFSDTGQVKAWEWPNGRPDLATLTACLEFFFGGGTCFQTPLDKALSICEASRFNAADIVFLTDGEANVDEDWRKRWVARRDAKEVRVWTILVGTRGAVISSLSDGVATVRGDVSDDGEALDLAFGF